MQFRNIRVKCLRNLIFYSYKKMILPLLESLIEAKLVQGNTVTLMRNTKPQEHYEILFNYKIFHDSNIVKALGRYSSDELLINCLQNVPLNSETYLIDIL